MYGGGVSYCLLILRRLIISKVGIGFCLIMNYIIFEVGFVLFGFF